MARTGRFRWRPQRQRLIDSINELTNTENCQDAVLLHQRPRWAWILAGVTFSLILLLGLLTSAPIYLVNSLTPLAIVSSLNLPGRRWVLARSEATVLLAESPKLWPRATRVVEVAVAPLDETHRGRRFNRWSMVLFGRRVLVPPGSSHVVARIVD